MRKMNFKSPLFPENSEKNRTKSGNLGKIVRFAIHTKLGIVLIEFVLSGDPLYMVFTQEFEFWFQILIPLVLKNFVFETSEAPLASILKN